MLIERAVNQFGWEAFRGALDCVYRYGINRNLRLRGKYYNRIRHLLPHYYQHLITANINSNSDDAITPKIPLDVARPR